MRTPITILVCAVVGLAAGVVPAPTAAAATVSGACTDGGGHRWSARASWGRVYVDGAGRTRATVSAVSFTSAARDATTVDYSVKTYDGAGARLQSLHESDRRFDFKGGTAYLTRNPLNPPSSPGKARVVLRLGDGNDGAGNCSITFVQPAGGSTPAPGGAWPASPPARVCGNTALLAGPASAPAGAIRVSAGDNARVDFSRAGRTYWFAPGVHRLGSGEYDQIVPADRSTFVGAPGAVLDGQHKNDYAFTQHAEHVTIKHLTIRNFVAPLDEGTVNHDSGAYWTMQFNTVTGNGGAGMFLGSHNVASYNCLQDNSQYGFQVYRDEGAASDVVLDHNEIRGNNTGNWEVRHPDCGCTGGGKFWDSRNVRVTSNYVHDNLSVGLWADTNDNNFLIQGNWIENNQSQALVWELSYNLALRNNVIRHNLTLDGAARIRSADNFPDAAIYLSESGGDARLPSSLVGSPIIDVSGNLIEDNYNGIALWENADRFCGSPANTSTDYCTLVNPSVVKASTCTASRIAKAPYYSDCRWKTQNVKVHQNTFRMNPAHFGNCRPSYCGRNAILSNYGSYPSWSPYQGDKVSNAITYHQGNVFRDNTYVGPWHFTVFDTGRLRSPSAWRGAPYRQDAGSTFRG